MSYVKKRFDPIERYLKNNKIGKWYYGIVVSDNGKEDFAPLKYIEINRETKEKHSKNLQVGQVFVPQNVRDDAKKIYDEYKAKEKQPELKLESLIEEENIFQLDKYIYSTADNWNNQDRVDHNIKYLIITAPNKSVFKYVSSKNFNGGYDDYELNNIPLTVSKKESVLEFKLSDYAKKKFKNFTSLFLKEVCRVYDLKDIEITTLYCFIAFDIKKLQNAISAFVYLLSFETILNN